jgi:hypothetical protein
VLVFCPVFFVRHDAAPIAKEGCDQLKLELAVDFRGKFVELELVGVVQTVPGAEERARGAER